MPTLLVIVTGLPGAGKTTFAQALAARIGARHLNTDIIRDALGLRGQYDEKSKQKVYRQLETRTASTLKTGKGVVVDGTFFRKELREPYQRLAEKNGAPACWLLIEAPEGVIRQRVAQKRKYSEADYEVYLKIRDAWEPLEWPHLTLVSEQLPDMLDKALAYLQIQNNSS